MSNGGQNFRIEPKIEKFPVIFPVSREFGVETGPIWTASSAKLSPCAIKPQPVDRHPVRREDSARAGILKQRPRHVVEQLVDREGAGNEPLLRGILDDQF
jgi:hypothetical protein